MNNNFKSDLNDHIQKRQEIVRLSAGIVPVALPEDIQYLSANNWKSDGR